VYTIEALNTLTGTRQHWKLTPYERREAAEASAKQHAARVRSFVTYNVLDPAGNVIASYKGQG
jgi:hypothetical protein